MDAIDFPVSLVEAEDQARQWDQEDELAPWREQFWMPQHTDGSDKLYLCGNSLGLQPKGVNQAVLQELQNWRELAVEGHFAEGVEWVSYQDTLRPGLAALVGAKEQEVVVMNTLTTNLHLMLVSFYRPQPQRYRIVMEKSAFPSDHYAVESQLRWHGYDPADALVELEDRPGTATLSSDTLAAYLQREGDTVALILMPGLQYLSGQWQDCRSIVELGRRYGCSVGFDLAHAVGNVPLDLHAWGADFAVWCSYKYLNGGPGAVAGCFVHERHHGQVEMPRWQGWWGHRLDRRFEMGPDFVPNPGADAWQLSNSPILALAPVKAALAMFEQVGMAKLRAKSIRLSGFLHHLVEARLPQQVEVATPAAPEQRGCQLSLRIRQGRERGRAVYDQLSRLGVVCDWREPDIIRVAPVPLYNRYIDVWRLVKTLSCLCEEV